MAVIALPMRRNSSCDALGPICNSVGANSAGTARDERDGRVIVIAVLISKGARRLSGGVLTVALVRQYGGDPVTISPYLMAEQFLYSHQNEKCSPHILHASAAVG